MSDIQTQMADGDDNDWFPEELQYTPVPYISLVGLSAQTNAIHALIWNSFTVNRGSDRSPLYFKQITDNYTFIASKPKKSSYEWHIPKGILKSLWLKKHLFDIPSVCVLFFELNWDDLNWNQKRTDCVARVEYLKRVLHLRNTKITLVLIQTSTPLPSDDSLVTERAALLCNSCDLNAKSLFVLPVSDVSQIMEYILRMESALYELSKLYYHNECKLVKSHADQLNKTTHQLLYVRHQFKIAFYSELKQDPNTALKHYKNAFAYLMELSTPLDAISQFRRHIDIFKGKCEPKEIEFEHSAWLSKQFSLFASLFEFAIISGLVASQVQNPGTYYLDAALQTMNRRKLCLSICSPIEFNSLTVEEIDLFNSVLQSNQEMEFFGQRSWRPGCQTLEPLDADKERIGLKGLQYKEYTNIGSLSAQIILSLSNAINQLKKYHCLRMQRYLMVLVADEYLYNRDYSNALTFLNNVLPNYRHERWLPLIEHILMIALKAAYLSADVINFVKLGLEIMASNCYDSQYKIAIQDSINNIIQKQSPLLLQFVDENDAMNALNLWTNALSLISDKIEINMKMESLMTFIECKPKFSSNIIINDKTIELNLQIKSLLPKQIQLTKLNILFTNEIYNQFCQITHTLDNTSDNSLILKPYICQKFLFNITPNFTEDSHQSIVITDVLLAFETQFFNILMQWKYNENNDYDTKCMAKSSIRPVVTYNIYDTPSTAHPSSTMPTVLDNNSPIFVELKYPDQCVARNPMILRYNILNKTDSELLLELSMGTSDNFMYSGNKLINIVLKTNENVGQYFILYPLICGTLELPKLKISIHQKVGVSSKQIDFMDPILPDHLFIFPQTKILNDILHQNC
ncbi:trafficking protein particle complex subunit 11-like isoform X2 [Oppia nitens]|uniref:trafficking protein particle complex subunit 11-like isoform X2 n=1 Tax=Oppia nitens TaxID=1686743 RepID=UPI0023DB270D|nr:trafficking protein particle complex subunit 11-like isoform X2 [Oppia nitens]